MAEKFRLPSSEIVLPGEDLVFCFVLSINLKLVLKFFINNDCKAVLKKTKRATVWCDQEYKDWSSPLFKVVPAILAQCFVTVAS